MTSKKKSSKLKSDDSQLETVPAHEKKDADTVRDSILKRMLETPPAPRRKAGD